MVIRDKREKKPHSIAIANELSKGFDRGGRGKGLFPQFMIIHLPNSFLNLNVETSVTKNIGCDTRTELNILFLFEIETLQMFAVGS